MSKLLFIPFSVIAGFLANKIASLTFERIWRLIDDHQPPEPKHRAANWPKVIGALALEGAIFRAVRGIFDRGSRELFSRLTGSWPGEERPEPV